MKIARRIDGDTVTYDDPVEHEAVQSLFFHEFHVIDFDNWIEGRVWESRDVLHKVMLARAEMLACMGRPETIDKGLDIARSMRAMMHRAERKAYRKVQSDLGSRDKTTMSEKEIKAVEFYNKLVRSGEKRGARGVAADKAGITVKRLDVCRARVKAGKK